MGVKENVMIAGGVTVVIGIGKALTRDIDIPGWLTLLVWLPMVALLGFFLFTLFEKPDVKNSSEIDRDD